MSRICLTVQLLAMTFWLSVRTPPFFTITSTDESKIKIKDIHNSSTYDFTKYQYIQLSSPTDVKTIFSHSFTPGGLRSRLTLHNTKNY